MTMPPSASWYRGLAAVRAFLIAAVFADATVRWRLRPTGANSRPAFGVYCAASPEGAYEPFGIQTVLVADGQIREMTTFTQPELFPRFGLAYPGAR
jgi:hypothetical protein